MITNKAVNNPLLYSRIEKRTLIANRRNGDLVLKKETALNQLLTAVYLFVTAELVAYVYYDPNTYVITQLVGPRVNYITGTTGYTNIKSYSYKINDYTAVFGVSFKVNQEGNNIFDEFGYFDQSLL